MAFAVPIPSMVFSFLNFSICSLEVFLPIKTEDDYMDYYGVQYLIAGNNEGFQGTEIGNISVRIAACHPDAAYKGEYFVIELGTFHIKCRFDKYKFK